MTSGIFEGLGGLGVFLLGMVVMTGGLKTLAGGALRRALARFTKSPLSGAVTGAVSTAVIQSSSATTVAAVGFVGAGLLTFSQALGIIFGANIGTTITGWLVAVLGFKMKIDTLALPFVFAGVCMNLFLKGRWSALGFAVAGFGLIFIGIDLMQHGMSELRGVVTPQSFPGDTVGGRLLLVLIGVAVTLVTQSSSAGMATALAAVNADTITFAQAAAMVIGMDVGTTATAAMATVGGSPDVRRTGFAHVIYNLMTGLMAFLLLTPYTAALQRLAPDWFAGNPELALVAFHTLFNTLGVLLVLPVTGAFARLMFWLVPDQPFRYTQRLDRSLYQSPEVAMEAVQGTLRELTSVVFGQLQQLLETGSTPGLKLTLEEANEALNQTRDYLTPIRTDEPPDSAYHEKLSAIHTIDHLRRLIDRCQNFKRAERARTEAEFEPLRSQLLREASDALVTLATLDTSRDQRPEFDESVPRNIWQQFETVAERDREKLIERAAAGRQDAHTTIRQLDTLRWFRRVSYHIWRILHHLHGAGSETDVESAEMPRPDTESAIAEG
jgi:phosphate:Na+ symporter